MSAPTGTEPCYCYDCVRFQRAGHIPEHVLAIQEQIQRARARRS